nr:hypothetical protein [Allomuricauda sp.]
MDFEQTLSQLKESLFHILGDEYFEFKEESKKDIEVFINDSKDKLERWTRLLTEGAICMDDYEWLLKSQRDLLVLTELEKAGISKIRLGHLKSKMVKAMVNIGRGLFLDIK